MILKKVVHEFLMREVKKQKTQTGKTEKREKNRPETSGTFPKLKRTNEQKHTSADPLTTESLAGGYASRR